MQICSVNTALWLGLVLGGLFPAHTFPVVGGEMAATQGTARQPGLFAC